MVCLRFVWSGWAFVWLALVLLCAALVFLCVASSFGRALVCSAVWVIWLFNCLLCGRFWLVAMSWTFVLLGLRLGRFGRIHFGFSGLFGEGDRILVGIR